MLLAVTVWVFQSLFHLPPQGFSVHLLRPELRSQAVSGIQPLYVRLEFRGVNHRPGLSVDSQPVAWEDFGNVLQNGLRSRPPSWPVYVEADRDVEWESAVKAVDVIRGLNAEVTLLTGRR
jgi:biopolymer transport protein ExbD